MKTARAKSFFVPPHLRKTYTNNNAAGRGEDDYSENAGTRNNRNNNNNNNKSMKATSKSNLSPASKPTARVEAGAGGSSSVKKASTPGIRPANHPFGMTSEQLGVYLGKAIADTVREIGLTGAALLAADDFDVQKSLGSRVAKAVREAKSDSRRREAVNEYDSETTAVWLGKLVTNAVKETDLDGKALSLADDYDIQKALGTRVAKEVRALHIENSPHSDAFV